MRYAIVAIEVHQKPHLMPAILAPVVQKVRIKADSSIATSVFTLDIPELEWNTSEETALQMLGKWRPVKEFCQERYSEG